MSVSERLWVAVKTSRRPAYKIAQEAGIHPSWLSKAINGIERVKPGDPRIISVGKILGIPESDCFEVSPDTLTREVSEEALPSA